jgi:hypothetical protein
MLLLAVDERRDDVTQGGQRQVDFDTFLESSSGSLSLGLALRACQIDEVQLSRLDSLLAIYFLSCLDVDGEETMRTR